MAGFESQKRSIRTKAAASGFNIPSGSNFRGHPGFSLSQTEPLQGHNSGPYWNGTGEGQQYLHQDPLSSQGNVQNGFPDSYTSFNDSKESLAVQNSTCIPFSGPNRAQWNVELSSAHMDSAEMSRLPSQDSVGAHSQRTTNSYDHGRSSRMYPNVTQMTFNMSTAGSDATGRSNSPDASAYLTPTQPMDLQAFNNFPYQGGDDMSVAHPLFHRDSTASIGNHPMVSMSSSQYSMYTTSGDEAYMAMATGSNALNGSGPVGRDSIYNNSSIMEESPSLWDNSNDFLESRRSSPITLEEPWSLPPPQMATSATDSPLDYSPSIEGLSPVRYVQDYPDLVELPPYTTTGDRVMRKPIGPRNSKYLSDIRRQQRHPGTSETSDEPSKVVGRSSLEIDNNARDHPMYHNVTPQADGLYHCPWEKDPNSNCTHKPEKLKCNYDKFVDSHLKPYKCKVLTCKELQFSSTACLLRHEREAHAMHGHGDKPFLCSYEGCERGVPGNGFPRHWNLCDHMKRVHNDPGKPKSTGSASPTPSARATPVALPKNKKRKAGDNPESPVIEKAPKRIASPAVVANRAQPQESVLEDHYREQHQMLLKTVNMLQDPRNTENMNLYRMAHQYMKVMAKLSERINPTSVGQNFQQSG